MTRLLATLGALAVALAVAFLWLREGERGSRAVTEPVAPAAAPASAPRAVEASPELVQAARALPETEPRPEREAPVAVRNGLAIAGKVVDDLGALVTTFAIELGRAGAGGDSQLSIDPKIDIRDFATADGRFRLEGLAAGQWRLTACSSERRSAPMVVEAGEGGSDVVLVLPRLAALAGVVIDAAGAAVREAEVFLLAPGEDERRQFRDPEPQTRTDDSGRFTLEGVSPGSVQLMARHPQFSDSDWMEVEVAPGERRTDVVITLTSGGRIEGRLDPSMGELMGREVSLFSFRGTIGWRDAKSDASGRFVIESVIPQDYVIELRPAGYGQGGFEYQPGIRKSVTVKEGETTEVVFGGARMQIAAHGRVTSRGQPASGLVVSANSREGGEDRGEEFTTGSDGRYELRLDGPGAYWFSVRAGADSCVGFERTVPEEASVELDFEVPAASLSGRVLDADGKPLARVPVTLLREADGANAEDFWGRHSSLYTGADGSFGFRLLSQGTYTLRAPDGHWLDSPPPRVPHGRALRTGLRIDGDHSIAGLELRLQAEGRVSGVVVDARDNPRGGAWIVLQDPEGVSLSANWETQSDATGHFEILSVAPGRYKAFASEGEKEGPVWSQASSAAFLVEAGRTASTKIVLP